jgi:integrase
LTRWLKTVEVEDSTRDGYIGYIERNIRPTLGAVPIAKLSTRMLETFYAELRRCRIRCNGRSTVAHRLVGEHTCDVADVRRTCANRWPLRPSAKCMR